MSQLIYPPRQGKKFHSVSISSFRTLIFNISCFWNMNAGILNSRIRVVFHHEHVSRYMTQEGNTYSNSSWQVDTVPPNTLSPLLSYKSHLMSFLNQAGRLHYSPPLATADNHMAQSWPMVNQRVLSGTSKQAVISTTKMTSFSWCNILPLAFRLPPGRQRQPVFLNREPALDCPPAD